MSEVATLPSESRAAKEVQARDQVDRDILIAMKKPGPLYWVAVCACFGFFVLGMAMFGNMVDKGFGLTGVSHPYNWSIYIVDFVFWVGIAHSGTLISAILLLFRAKFRNRFNRQAEAMTCISVLCAGMYPILHLGRPWFNFFLFPYPTERQLWINFRSPLTWDVFAVSTYLIVSMIFFYVGMIPDLAIARQYATGLRKKIYGILSLGWRGTDREWKHYEKVCLFLAALAAPLVVSVHSVVSWDFAMSLLPGWHATIFAPYFVAGAIFSGCGMVLTLVIPMRKIFRLEKYITIDHFDKLCKLIMFTSMIVGYAYLMEVALANYGTNPFEKALFDHRMGGHYRIAFWMMVFCNCIAPLTLWVKKLRHSIPWLFVLSILINIGMWLERYVIVVTSLSNDFDPYNWGYYVPTIYDFGLTIMNFGFFFGMFLLFCRFLPMMAIMEVKEEVK
ncbi:MAG: polysulfide reductase NrfD [Planctomycetes bacterium]|nr:polysulfide reductase NrfD [Planctomycetota bacterium]